MNMFEVLNSILVHLSSVLLNNFILLILPIHFFLTIDCTLLEDDYKLVTLVAYMCRFDTQGDDEGDYSLFLGQTLVKLTQAPWSVHPWVKLRGNLH
jgi:hypothetical protein